MDDFDRYMKEYEEKKEAERKAFFKKCTDKINNGEFIYHLLGFAICERFKLKLNYNGEAPEVVWALVNHYIDNVNEDWIKWLSKDDSPMIKPISSVKKIFPELAIIYDDEEDIIKTANKLYNLKIYIADDYFDTPEYIYAFNFDFNSFKPIQVNEIKTLKNEKEVLKKYGHDTTEIDKKISEFGLNKEEIEAI